MANGECLVQIATRDQHEHSYELVESGELIIPAIEERKEGTKTKSMLSEEKHAETTVKHNSYEEMPAKNNLDETEAKSSEKKVPTKSQVKWEKKTLTNSSSIPRKPDLLGNNVMVSKVEQESSVGESMPSVYEIPAPREK